MVEKKNYFVLLAYTAIFVSGLNLRGESARLAVATAAVETQRDEK